LDRRTKIKKCVILLFSFSIYSIMEKNFQKRNNVYKERYMEEEILTIKIDKKDTMTLELLYDFFKDEHIEYDEKTEEGWEGIKVPTYILYTVFYIHKKDEEKVKQFIEDLENATPLTEEYEELRGCEEESEEEEEKRKRRKKREKIIERIFLCICLLMAIGFMIFTLIF